MKKLRKFPLSLLLFLVILYLSLFRPPSEVSEIKIPHLDKLVHFCMYLGFSGVLWFELIKSEKNFSFRLNGVLYGCLLPIMISGLIELLQEYCTTYRGGEWLDFLANTLGVLAATIVAYLILRRRIKEGR